MSSSVLGLPWFWLRVDEEVVTKGLVDMFIALSLASRAWRREAKLFWLFMIFSLQCDHNGCNVGLDSLVGGVL